VPSGEEVVAMTSSAEYELEPGRAVRLSLDELARRRGVHPVDSVGDMAGDGIFASDDEFEEFLAHLREVAP
jgi:hypothetical protein